MPEVGTHVAGALLDLPPAGAESTLERLVQARFLEPLGTSCGRYRLHDLVRLFAADLPQTPPCWPAPEDALHRALPCYLDAAEQCAALYRGNTGPQTTEGFAVPYPDPIPIQAGTQAVASSSSTGRRMPCNT